MLPHACIQQLVSEPRVVKCILVGYAFWVKRYRLWYTDHNSPKFIISRDVIFYEDALLDARKQVEKSEIGSSGDTVEVESTYQVGLVAKGYSLREGIDYLEVFSLVVKHTSIHVLLTLVAANNLEEKLM